MKSAFPRIKFLPLLLLLSGTASLSWGKENPVPTSWPKVSELFSKASEGQWVRYKQSQSQAGKSQIGTLRQTLKDLTKEKVQIEFETNTTSPSQSTKTMVVPFPSSGDFLKQPIPRSGKLLSQKTTKTNFSNLKIGKRKYSGTKYLDTTSVQFPNGMTLTSVTELWISPQVPVSGMAKFSLRMSGAMTMSSRLEIETSSLDELALQFQKTEDLLTYASNQADSPPSDYFLAYKGVALLAAGRLEDAFRHLEAIPKSQFQRNILLEAFKNYASQRSDKEWLLKLGVEPAQIADEIRTRKTKSFLSSESGTSLPAFQAFVRKLPQKEDKEVAVLLALEKSFPELSSQKVLLEEFLSLAAQKKWFDRQTNVWKMHPPSLEILQFAESKFPEYRKEPDFLINYSKALFQAGQENRARSLAEEYLSLPLATSKASGAQNLLQAIQDPRYAQYARLLAKERLASSDLKVAAQYGSIALRASRLRAAKSTARLGDFEKARGLLDASSPTYVLDLATLVTEFYGAEDKKEEAIALKNKLFGDEATQAAKEGFRLLGARSQVNLGFAQWERSVGNHDGADYFLKEAIQEALRANSMEVALNQNSQPKKFWRVDLSSIHQDPYHPIVSELAERNQEKYDNQMLSFMGELKSEMPASNVAEDLWSDVAGKAAKRNSPLLLTKVYKLLPSRISGPSRLALILASLQYRKHERTRQEYETLVETQSSLEAQAEILRIGIQALAVSKNLEDTKLLFGKLKEVTEKGANFKHQALAAVALAQVLAEKGNSTEALSYFKDRTPSVLASSGSRKILGPYLTALVFKLGVNLGNQKLPLATLSAWCKEGKSLDESTFLALGMYKGLSAQN